MIKVSQIKLPVKHTENELNKKIMQILRLNKYKSEIYEYRIVKRSLDARKKPDLYFVYSVCVEVDKDIENRILSCNRDKNVVLYKENTYCIPEYKELVLPDKAPVIIGAGPAGLFCAYVLCQKGFKPIVIERGECVDDRVRTVEAFFEGSKINVESNVQFGEGGAGTFSDGKLNTLVNDKLGRNQYVLDTFIKFGAKEEIGYVAKPHLGTDALVDIVRNMRNYIISMGGKFYFNTKLTDICIEDNTISKILVDSDKIKEISTDCIVLAIGHSARDTFSMLKDKEIVMEQKNFAVGLRIQHPQKDINKSQYGAELVDELKAADYKLTNQCSNGRSVYSFCMCPGGYVVNASSEENRLAVNGMSYSGRDSLNANSAIIVSVDRKDFGSDDVLAGLNFQRKLEEKAYMLGEGSIPIQLYADFKNDRKSDHIGNVEPVFKGSYKLSNLRELFNEEMNEAIIESIDKFGYTLEGFDRKDAILAGVESRTSSPVRIVRNELYESNFKGIFPCGEGAGYAGGITSAAMDGIKVAEKIIEKYTNKES